MWAIEFAAQQYYEQLWIDRMPSRSHSHSPAVHRFLLIRLHRLCTLFFVVINEKIFAIVQLTIAITVNKATASWYTHILWHGTHIYTCPRPHPWPSPWPCKLRIRRIQLQLSLGRMLFHQTKRFFSLKVFTGKNKATGKKINFLAHHQAFCSHHRRWHVFNLIQCEWNVFFAFHRINWYELNNLHLKRVEHTHTQNKSAETPRRSAEEQ